MDDWFSIIDARGELSAGAVQDLRDVGFIVIPGPVAPDRLAQLAEAYDSGVACAASDDVSIGSTTTRVHDFVNRGPEIDGLYVYEPVLEACCRIIGQPYTCWPSKRVVGPKRRIACLSNQRGSFLFRSSRPVNSRLGDLAEGLMRRP